MSDDWTQFTVQADRIKALERERDEARAAVAHLSGTLPVPPEDVPLLDQWRSGPVTFSHAEATRAICAALNREGIRAWPGDGVSIVAQMLEHAYRQRDAIEAATLERAARVCEAETVDALNQDWIAACRECAAAIRREAGGR